MVSASVTEQEPGRPPVCSRKVEVSLHIRQQLDLLVIHFAPYQPSNTSGLIVTLPQVLMKVLVTCPCKTQCSGKTFLPSVMHVILERTTGVFSCF